jgi:hypothetical protein
MSKMRMTISDSEEENQVTDVEKSKHVAKVNKKRDKKNKSKNNDSDNDMLLDAGMFEKNE